MNRLWLLAVIASGVLFACTERSVNDLPEEVRAVADVINRRRDAADCGLVVTARPLNATTLQFTIENHLDTAWSSSPDFLPWRRAAVLAIGEQTGLLDRVYPIADDFRSNPVVPPGSSLSGELDLCNSFPALMETTKAERIHVFWLYDPGANLPDCLSAGSAVLTP